MAWPWQKNSSDTRDVLREVTLAIGQVMGRSAGAAPAAIEPTSLLGADLGLSSVAVARLAGILQKRCGRKPLPLHALFVTPDGAMLQDLRVSDIVSFLERHLGANEP